MDQVRDVFDSLSVVIPAYNAAGHVRETLADVRQWLARFDLPHEIIVIDDGSIDNTRDLLRGEPGIQLFENGINRGKGFSVRRGMLATRCAWALFMDVDNSTSLGHLERFAPAAAAADVLIASRRLSESRIVRRQHPIRQFLGRSFPYLVRALAIPDLADTQCGFKLFRREAVRQIFPKQRIERFAFDVEVLMLARRLGLRIVEVPVNWDNPTSSTLRVRIDTLQMMWDLLRTTWRIRIRGQL